MYAGLGTKDVAELAEEFKSEFDTMNTDGQLGKTLHALFEMRLEDITMSMQHVKKMKTVLHLLQKSDHRFSGQHHKGKAPSRGR